jgi:hypothetical protein
MTGGTHEHLASGFGMSQDSKSLRNEGKYSKSEESNRF